jgi:endonuclease/exonuclease/phosphatase family metal-dependent hydrolase
MRRRTITTILCLLVAAACASDDDASGGSDTTRARDTADDTDDDTADGPLTDDTADDAADTADGTSPTLSVATVNILHGLHLGDECPPETDACRARERLELLWAELEAAGCPDLVGLQEVGPAHLDLLDDRLGDLCDGSYVLATDWVGLPVEVAVLSRLPVVETRAERLSGISWGAQWVRADSALGPVELFTAHFASAAEPFECEADSEYCASMCEPGALPGDCHPLEALALFDEVGDIGALQFLVGDLNRPADDPRITTLTDAGFVDLWLAADGPECDPDTGEGCTCCISGDGPLGGLDSPEATFRSRIDFILARAPEACTLEVTDVALVGSQPRTDPVAGVHWPSDHAGVLATVACR